MLGNLGRKFMFSGSEQDPNNHGSLEWIQKGVHSPISNLEDRYQGSRRWIFFQNLIPNLDPWDKFYILPSWKLTYPYTVCHFWRWWFSQLPVWWDHFLPTNKSRQWLAASSWDPKRDKKIHLRAGNLIIAPWDNKNKPVFFYHPHEIIF